MGYSPLGEKLAPLDAAAQARTGDEFPRERVRRSDWRLLVEGLYAS